jgi:hypothetical protein
MSQFQTRGFLFAIPTLVALAVGVFIGRSSVERHANAQVAGGGGGGVEGRFAVSSCVGTAGPGAYIIDTRTGDAFQTGFGGEGVKHLGRATVMK